MMTQSKNLDVMVFFELLQSLQKELDGEATIKQLQILCLVGRFPGITSKQLVQYINLHPAALSRSFKVLSQRYERDRKGNKVLKGHNLIEVRPSLEGGRQFAYYLTDQGTQLMKKVGLRLE